MSDDNYINQNQFIYPPIIEESFLPGVYPVDFIVETILRAGINWFLTDPEAPGLVFGQLKAPWLSKYGEPKINEISAYIAKYDIKIVQHFSLVAQSVPCISIQLLDGNEEEARAALDDHMEMQDAIGENNAVAGRQQFGYAPIIDNVHIGIHAHTTPDLTKYLYYLIVYVLSSFKPQLQERGLNLTTFRVTDISKLNEYLPENIYSRFINFSMWTMAPFRKGKVPIIERILGVHVPPQDRPNEVYERPDEMEGDIRIEAGLTVTDEDSD